MNGGQGLTQFLDLLLAFGLCSLIGLERELRQRSAGLRTNTLVGLAAALIMLVSKYGFGDVIGNGVVLDPSRIAAQIVSGIGFIGGGLIFVRQDAVRGLTTAAVIWISAAVDMAAGANLPLLAIGVTALHLFVVTTYPWLLERLPGSRLAPLRLRVVYQDAQGVLRRLLAQLSERGFSVTELLIEREPVDKPGNVSVLLELRGRGDRRELAGDLADLSGVHRVELAEPSRVEI
jgi:putative Mg2+ transporter-C (MgtC) family protein